MVRIGVLAVDKIGAAVVEVGRIGVAVADAADVAKVVIGVEVEKALVVGRAWVEWAVAWVVAKVMALVVEKEVVVASGVATMCGNPCSMP